MKRRCPNRDYVYRWAYVTRPLWGFHAHFGGYYTPLNDIF